MWGAWLQVEKSVGRGGGTIEKRITINIYMYINSSGKFTDLR